ncbi:hypothetical protein B0J14DRAFT_466895 [Halenospora varia]|nr:hypothetical protein B0J14DRAFT_466895 [Halenospora varia]
MPRNFLPNHRLVCLSLAHSTEFLPQPISTSSSPKTWEGRKPEDHAAREKDSHNVQHDAVKEGKSERARDEGSRGATERSEGSNEKVKKEFPEAPDTVGMQDARGGVS